MSWTQLNKFCAIMNIPCPDRNTFKRHEAEIGVTAESVAKSSCREAAAIERELVLKNVETIEKSL